MTFDASHSIISQSTITDAAWDLSGGTDFTIDTGRQLTITHSFASLGIHSVSVRIARAGGRVETATTSIDVRPAPPRGNVGISIDGGDFATDNPNVQLDLVWPPFAKEALISNDGGFEPAGGTATDAAAPQVPWTLEQSGSEQLPKTAYLRFLGAGIDIQNFTDYIILDQTPLHC